MMIYKALLNGAIVSLLYMTYRYSNENMEMFWVCIIGSTYFIRKLYLADKTT